MMSEQQVVDLMVSSRNEAEWNSNCERVKASCGGYPSSWYGAVVTSGLMHAMVVQWNKSATP